VTPLPDSPARRWRLGAGAVIALVAFVFATGLLLSLLFKPDMYGIDPERQAIEQTRAANLARARLGLAVPGTPDLTDLNGRLTAHSVTLGAPILIRIFKASFELELWMARDGRYHRFATYPICRWSGRLGPKLATGDRQAPEGFYTVAADQLNPNSRWHRSFNVGFPNAFDRAHGRTGDALMVHGGCSSAGCYAMTNAVIDEIWKLTTAALYGAASGKEATPRQKRFQVQIYPFRMTDDALARHASSPHIGFWRQLKQGSDTFEKNWLPPTAAVCKGHYRFTPGSTVEANPVAAVSCAPGTLDAVGLAKKPL
jgi:murein L,D-transpeptidase YafK